MNDLISRQAAIDIERNATVDTNPSHFVAHQKFTQFLDDAEISSFGRWQWSNGFNTALTAVGIDLKNLPSAQPETHEERTETHARDLIDRQTAIDAILAVTGNSSVRELYEHVQEHGLSDMWSGGVNAAIDIIIAVPSAQPELTQNLHNACTDLISRQAAIELIERMKPYHQEADDIAEMIDNMPSAQPEIVYCKDCICGHGEVWLSGNGSADFYGYCGRTQLRVLPYDYCSYAKRRTDE